MNAPQNVETTRIHVADTFDASTVEAAFAALQTPETDVDRRRIQLFDNLIIYCSATNGANPLPAPVAADLHDLMTLIAPSRPADMPEPTVTF